MRSITQNESYKLKLLSMKSDLLNRFRSSKLEVTAIEKMLGDEVDQSLAQQEENYFILNQMRLKSLLFEIDMALSRIEQGTYGVCEETHEPIEQKRLEAIPYTRLSIEGAEIREVLQKKYAR